VDLFKKRVVNYIIGAIIRSNKPEHLRTNARAFKNQRKSIQEPTQEHSRTNAKAFKNHRKSISRTN